MQRGRKPKPLAVLKLEGTYRATRHRRRQAEPAAEGELAKCQPPSWLTANQKRVWRQIIKDAPRGILKRADRQTFLAYVMAVARFEAAARTQNKLDEMGQTPLLVRGATGSAVSPYVKILDRATLLMTQLGAELGFSPTSRARLGRAEEPRVPSDEGAWSVLRRFPVIDGGKSAKA